MRRLRTMQTAILALAAAASVGEPAWADPEYEAVGAASWYGEQFHGRKTASGERFDMNLLTAAHPKLPMGTLLEVTNLDNDRTIQVRVNDRGPYAHSRILDVSREAAEQLGFRSKGVARVQIRYAGRSPGGGLRPTMPVDAAPQVLLASDTAPVVVAAAEAPLATIEPAARAAKGAFLIQAGAFSKKDNADRAVATLSSQGMVTVRPLVLRGLTLHRVLVGSWPDAASAEAALAGVAAAGFEDAEVVSAF